MKVKYQDLSAVIDEVLLDYSEDVTKGLKKEVKSATKKLVDKTKSTAPVGKRKKHYKDNITSKTVTETPKQLEKVWYVKGGDHRLTHLLNNGHQTRNGGRVKGTYFLSNAVDEVIPEFENKVEEIIKNGK